MSLMFLSKNSTIPNWTKASENMSLSFETNKRMMSIEIDFVSLISVSFIRIVIKFDKLFSISSDIVSLHAQMCGW